MNFDSPQTFSRWFKNLDTNPPIFYKQIWQSTWLSFYFFI
jgi:hypothetical protein